MTSSKKGIPTHDDSVPSNLKYWLQQFRKEWLKAANGEDSSGEPVPHVGARSADGTHGTIQKALSMRGTTTNYNYRRFLTVDRNLANFEEVDMPTTEEINTSRIDAGGKMSGDNSPAPEAPKKLVKRVLNDVETTTMERLLALEDDGDFQKVREKIADTVETLSKTYARASDESEIENDYVKMKPNEWNYSPNHSKVAHKQRKNFKSSLKGLLDDHRRLDPRIAHLVFADLDTEYDILPTTDAGIKNHIAALANEGIYTIASMGFDISVDESTGKIQNDFKREYRYDFILSEDNYRFAIPVQPEWGLSRGNDPKKLFTKKAKLDNLGRRDGNKSPYNVSDLANFTPLGTKFQQYEPLYTNYRGQSDNPIWGPGKNFSPLLGKDDDFVPSVMDEYAGAFYKLRGMHKTAIKWGGNPGVLNSLLRHMLRFGKMRAHVNAGARELVTSFTFRSSDLSQMKVTEALGYKYTKERYEQASQSLTSDLLIDRGGYNTLNDDKLLEGRRGFPHTKFPAHLGLWAGSDGPNLQVFSNIWLGADPRLAQHRRSLLYLLGVDNEDLESHMSSTLELSSHRLDAWWTSIANRRLTELRAAEDNWYTRDPPDYQQWKKQALEYGDDDSYPNELRPWKENEALPVPPGPEDPPSREPQDLPGGEGGIDYGDTVTGDYPDVTWPDPSLEPGNQSGIYVGAWGFVEDLSDDPGGTDPGEYVQTPSLQQATTAAILRGGNQAYEAQDEGHLSAVDLSADRVRIAQAILDGVRDGQPLKTVLGYRFERALQEGDLQQHILDFREEFPAFPENENRQQTQSWKTDVGAKYDVVDGYRLYKQIEYKSASEDAVVLTQDANYDTSTLPDPTVDSGTGNAIEATLLELLDAVDAVRDLLTAESIHQFAQGNFSRARVSLDAVAADGEVPDLDVVDTPRTETSLTHRLSLTFGDLSASLSSEWTFDNVLDHPKLADFGGGADLSVAEPNSGYPLQVRADAEPNLDDWLSDVLPKSKDVGCSAAFEWSEDRRATAGTFTTPPESNHVSVTDVGFQPDVVLFTATPAVGDFEARDGSESEGTGQSSKTDRTVYGWTHGAARRKHDASPKQHAVGVGYDAAGSGVTTAVTTEHGLEVVLQGSGKRIQCEILEMTDEGFEVDVTLKGGARAPPVAVEYVAIETGDLSAVEIGHFTPTTGGSNASEGLPFDADHAILTTTDGFDASGFGGGSATQTASGTVGISRGEVVSDASGTSQHAVSVAHGAGQNADATVGADDGNVVSLPGTTASVSKLDTTLELSFSAGTGTARPVTYVAFDSHSEAPTPELGVATDGETKLAGSFKPGWIEFVAVPGVTESDFTGGAASHTYSKGIGGIGHGRATAVHEQQTLSHGAGPGTGQGGAHRIDGLGSSKAVVSLVTMDKGGNETQYRAKLSAIDDDGFTLQFTDGNPDDVLVLYRVWSAAPAEIDHRATTSMTFNELVMTPLDVLFGSQANRDEALTELERRIGYYLLRARESKVGGTPGTDRPPIPGDATVDLTLGDSGGASISGADFLEVVRSVRDLVTEGRAATADDYVHPAERGGTGYDKGTYEELHGRAETLHAAMKDVRDLLENRVELIEAEVDDKGNELPTLTEQVDEIQRALSAFRSAVELPGVVSAIDRLEQVASSQPDPQKVVLEKEFEIELADLVAALPTGPTEMAGADEPVQVEALGSRRIRGVTNASANSTVRLELRGYSRADQVAPDGTASPLDRTIKNVSVDGDGAFDEEIDFHDVTPGTHFTLTAVDGNGGVVYSSDGRVLEPTTGIGFDAAAGQTVEGTADVSSKTKLDVSVKNEKNPGAGLASVSVSDKTVETDETGDFSATVDLSGADPGTPLVVTATDPGGNEVFDRTGYVRRPPRERDPVAVAEGGTVLRMLLWLERVRSDFDPGRTGSPAAELQAKLDDTGSNTEIDWGRIDTEVSQVKDWHNKRKKQSLPGRGRPIAVAIDNADVADLKRLKTLSESKYDIGTLGNAVTSLLELPRTAGVTGILDPVGGRERPDEARVWATASDEQEALVRGELAQLLRNPQGLDYTSVDGFAPEFEAFVAEIAGNSGVDFKNREERLFEYLDAFFGAAGELVRSLRGDLKRPDQLFEGLRDAAFYPSRFSGSSGVPVSDVSTRLQDLHDYYAGAGLDSLDQLAKHVNDAQNALGQQGINSPTLNEMAHWVGELRNNWQETTIKGYLKEFDGLLSQFETGDGRNVPQKTQQIKQSLQKVKTELQQKQTWRDVETLEAALSDVEADRYLTTDGNLNGGTPATEFVYLLDQIQGHLDEYETWLTSGSPPKPVFDAGAARTSYATRTEGDFSDLLGGKSTVDAFIDVDRSTQLNDVFRRCVLETLRIPMLRAGYFGVFASIPLSATGGDHSDEDALLGQATAVLGRLKDRLEEADDRSQAASDRAQHAKNLPNSASDRAVREAYAEAAEAELARLDALFDEEFTVLPPIAPANQTELSNTFEEKHRTTLLSAADPMEVETWLQRQARVRQRPELLREALTYAEMLTGAILRRNLSVGQLPFRADDDWAGIDAEDRTPSPPPDGTVSIVTYFASQHSGTKPIATTPDGNQGSRIAGLYVDDWRVAIPSTEETTGIAVNYDDPGMEPPQSMLLAVPPTEDEREESTGSNDPPPWTDETLIRTVLEAIDLTKMRGVDLDAIGNKTDSGKAAEDALGHMLPGLLFPQNTKHRPDVPSTRFRLDTDLAKYLRSNVILKADPENVVDHEDWTVTSTDGESTDNGGDD